MTLRSSGQSTWGTVQKATSVLRSPESVSVIVDTEWEFQKVWFGGLALNNQLIITAFCTGVV